MLPETCLDRLATKAEVASGVHAESEMGTRISIRARPLYLLAKSSYFRPMACFLRIGRHGYDDARRGRTLGVPLQSRRRRLAVAPSRARWRDRRELDARIRVARG